MRFLKLSFHVPLVQRDFNGGQNLPFLNRLEYIAEGTYGLGPLNHLLIGIGRQENYRYFQGCIDLFGSGNPVEFSWHDDIHEHQVRVHFQGHLNRLGPRCRFSDDVKSLGG